MESSEHQIIVTAERLHGGALIVFSDGCSAIYSAALLYSVLSQAETVQEPDFEEPSSGFGRGPIRQV